MKLEEEKSTTKMRNQPKPRSFVTGQKRWQSDQLVKYQNISERSSSGSEKMNQEDKSTAVSEPWAPTYLILKFSPESQLPSAQELKLRFAWFGPIYDDHVHVSQDTFTCQVLFKNKRDAEAAYKSKIHHRFALAEVEGSCMQDYIQPDQVQVQVQVQAAEELEKRMLELLHRVSDTVNNIKEAFGLGYIPYHLFLHTGQGPSNSNSK